MDIHTLGLTAAALLMYALVSGRLQSTVITAPLVFILIGSLLGSTGIAHIELNNTVIQFIAEFTLILVLFTDAARIDLVAVKKDHNLPQRLLLVGLPLTILCGTLLALALFSGFSIWEAALLAALLAPTDAALGQSVVSSKTVPVRIRQAINIESGLNDGIALPAVLLFASLAEGAIGAHEGTGTWVQFILLQLILGPVIGLLVGAAGAAATDRATDRGWMGEDFLGISILALAVLLYVISESVGGNGFIAVFVGGMMYGNRLKHTTTFLFEFMETEGQLLMLMTFLIFGAVMLPEALEHARPVHLVYALTSLSLVRILPVLVALSGTGLRLPTKLFLGWFGPRGLASILFLLLILEESELEASTTIFTVTVLTVALSALLHGLSAAPLANMFGRSTARMGESEENRHAVEIPLRHGHIKIDKVVQD